MKQTQEGVIITIKAKPNSGKTMFEKDFLKLKASPENNKANLEMIRFLRKLFKKEIRIISGIKSKKKTLLVKNANEKEITLLLQTKHP